VDLDALLDTSGPGLPFAATLAPELHQASDPLVLAQVAQVAL
jgi:hypothetical protein